MAKRALTKTHKLFQEAKRYLVGGVNSPVRSFAYVGGDPVLIKSGSGSNIYDYDGNEYIDYVLSWGALILGHTHPLVLGGLNKSLKFGLGFGATHKSEVELAKIIHHAIPFIEKIRFVNSGTEAVMGAVRVARGYTKKDKILKFRNTYHGHADYLLARAGSGLASLNMPSSKGVPKDFIKDTIILPQDGIQAVEKVLKRYGRQIAAVLVEPAGGNYGVIAPDTEFLRKLRVLTRQHGVLLIFDEVITGFRFHFGALAELLGIIPDLVCLGKIIGGGLPVGAFGGRKEIMENLAPVGRVYQASTFAGNPIVMQSGLATIGVLKYSESDYLRIKELTEYLSLRIEQEARLRKIDLKVNHYGPMFSLKFSAKNQFSAFYLNMLKERVYFAPSEFEANFLSFAHTKGDIDKTIDSFEKSLDKL